MPSIPSYTPMGYMQDVFTAARLSKGLFAWLARVASRTPEGHKSIHGSTVPKSHVCLESNIELRCVIGKGQCVSTICVSPTPAARHPCRR